MHTFFWIQSLQKFLICQLPAKLFKCIITRIHYFALFMCAGIILILHSSQNLLIVCVVRLEGQSILFNEIRSWGLSPCIFVFFINLLLAIVCLTCVMYWISGVGPSRHVPHPVHWLPLCASEGIYLEQCIGFPCSLIPHSLHFTTGVPSWVSEGQSKGRLGYLFLWVLAHRVAKG